MQELATRRPLKPTVNSPSSLGQAYTFLHTLGIVAVTFLLQRVFQERILEPKIRFDPRTPTSLVVKVDVSTLFVLVRRHLWFFVALEPSHVLLVEAPALFLQLSSGQVLLVGSLRVIKYEEETVCS